MNGENQFPSRRQFVQSVAAMLGGVAAGLPAVANASSRTLKPLKLGIDNFAVRAMKWNDKQLIDYAEKLQVDALFITDFYAFPSLDDAHLKEVRSYAADKGIDLYLGNWSICPTSVRFKKEWGTAEEHLNLGIRAAKALGSPVFRVILGGGDDRLTEGGIDARIDDTVKVLKACRGHALDSGVKIAIENHAGDMHSLELVRLIEAAGKEWVGANMDSGNATWTLEDPLVNLENLGPYTFTTSLRDSAVWESEHGVTIQWTAMGDGMVDWEEYFARFAELCPEAPVNIETISGFNRELPVNKQEFWKAWPQGKPKGYDQFLAWANRGKPRAAHQLPEGVDRNQAEQEYQRAELERSIKYCQSIGLGRK